MRALVIRSTAASPELAELPTPTAAAGELLVRVHAASVNGFDLAVAAGYVEAMMDHRYPVVLGKDFAGVVAGVGEGVEGYRVDDRVFGVVTKPFIGDGSFGEYVTVPVAIGVAHLPADVSFVDGAALGLAGTAAVTAVESARLEAGTTVLVFGATGGVGNQVVQLASRDGATVVATAHTEEERAELTRLGATATVDHEGDLAAALRSDFPEGVDVVVHLAGDPAALLPLVRDGGRFVSTLVGSPDDVPAGDVTVVPVFAQPTAQVLDRLASAHADGTTGVRIEGTYPLSAAPDALADFARGTLGKLVLEIG